MTDRHIAQKAPFPLAVEAGKTYYWCSCGMSKNQPLCDGSHQGTSHLPVAYTPDKDGTAYFCGCKASHKEPLCDGSHGKL